MGAKSSKTKPAQPDTVVETFNVDECSDDTTSTSNKRTRTSSGRKGLNSGGVVKEIWSTKEPPPSRPTSIASPPPSPKKRMELQVSSDEDSDAGRSTRMLTKKKSRKKKRKGSGDNASPQKGSSIKLNEVQVVKRPPGDISPERHQRFEQIKVAYSMRDATSRNLDTPSPSRAESKAESMARFFGRDSKTPAPAPPGGSSSNMSTHSKTEDTINSARPPSSATMRPPSGYHSFKGSDPNLRAQTPSTRGQQSKDEQELQFHAHCSDQDSTELLDIDDLEREESVFDSRLTEFSVPRATLTPASMTLDASKSTESRSASLPPPQLPRRPSPAHSLRLDDADESFMSAILHDDT